MHDLVSLKCFVRDSSFKVEKDFNYTYETLAKLQFSLPKNCFSYRNILQKKFPSHAQIDYLITISELSVKEGEVIITAWERTAYVQNFFLDL